MYRKNNLNQNIKGNTQTMTKKTDAKKDLTKKDLIKILKKIDSERINRNLKKGTVTKKKLKF